MLENSGTLNLIDGSELFSNDNTANLVQNDTGGTISYASTDGTEIGVVIPVANAGTIST